MGLASILGRLLFNHKNYLFHLFIIYIRSVRFKNAILISSMTVFNNISADIKTKSADVILKLIIVLREMRVLLKWKNYSNANYSCFLHVALDVLPYAQFLKSLQNKKGQKIGKKAVFFPYKRTAFLSGTPNFFGPSYFEVALVGFETLGFNKDSKKKGTA